MTATQPSKLLSSLFEQFHEDDRLTVLHIGAALPETVQFFSRYRCKLHFIDLFCELPMVADESGPDLQQQFTDHLQFPADTRIDICLFWDLFNFLDSESIAAFLSVLRPCLRTGGVAHGFAVHNLKTPQGDQVYGIHDTDQLSVRSRKTSLPGYLPHNQGQLKQLLEGFSFTRSVLLPDSRLEFLLRVDH